MARRPIATDTEVVIVKYVTPHENPLLFVADSPEAADALIIDYMQATLAEMGDQDAKADLDPIVESLNEAGWSELFEAWEHHFGGTFDVEHYTVHRASTAIDDMREAVEEDA